MSTAPPIYYADLSPTQRAELIEWVGSADRLFPDTDIRPIVEAILAALDRARAVYDHAATTDVGGESLSRLASACETETQGLLRLAPDVNDARFQAWITWKAVEHVDCWDNDYMQGIRRGVTTGHYSIMGSGAYVSESHRKERQKRLAIKRTPAIQELVDDEMSKPGNPSRRIELSAITVAEEAVWLLKAEGGADRYVFEGHKPRASNELRGRHAARYPGVFLRDLARHFGLETTDPIRDRLDRAEWLTYPRWGLPVFGRRVGKLQRGRHRRPRS